MKTLLARLLGRLPIGWLQLRHDRVRLLAAVGGVTFANVLIFMQLGFMSALFETSVLTHRDLVADVVLTSSDFRTLREANPLPRARLHQALTVAGVASATPIHLATLEWTDPLTEDTTNFRVLGVDPEARIFEDAELQEQLGRLREQDSLLVDRETRDFPQRIEQALSTRGRFALETRGRTLSVVGAYSQGASFDVDGTLVVSDQTFMRLFPSRRPGTPSLVAVRLEAGADPRQVVSRMESVLPAGDARAYTKAQFVAAEQDYQAQQSPIGFVFGFGVLMGLVVGLVIVYQVLSTDVQDHLAEYATLKAIGYGPRYFLGLVFEEAACLSALGFVPGLTIASTLYVVAAQATALPIEMPWTRPLLVFFLTAAMCAVSGAIATRRLAAADPADLF